MDGVEDLLTLPRSVRLALWLHGVGAGPNSGRRAVRAVQGDDEPHGCTGAEGLLGPAGGTLDELVALWGSAPGQTAALLPVPGDVSGLPHGAAEDAVEAGECALISVPSGCWVLVPEVVTFGSAWEVGHLVTWRVHPVPDWRHTLPGLVGTLSEAEQSLRRALLEATEALAGLDVARWRPDAAATIASLRSDADPGWSLPTLAPRALRVLAGAVRLRAIVALATADDGGAVNLWQADQRSTALRHIDHAARRAVAAATVSASAGDQPSTER